MKKYQVVVSDAAFEAIQGQAQYIAVEQQAPETAARWLKRILEAADTLESTPSRCALALEDRYRPYEVRSLLVASFVLLFTIDEEAGAVVVIGARHEKQLARPGLLP